MKLTFDTILKLAEVKNIKQLSESKDNKLKEIASHYDKQFKLRSKLKTRVVNDREIRYSSQDCVQARVVDNCFTLENIKTCAVSLERISDTVQLEKSEVKKLIDYFNKHDDFAEFKRVFRNLSMFVLFTHSNSVMNKHERFYSQCLEQIDYLLNKYYVSCEKSRSKKIEVKEKTLLRRTSEHENIMQLLNMKSKSKSKTRKAVKARKKRKVKVS